ncbi:hypothetical protein AB0J82_38420 [Asanoa sp. NPDC049518]|uniref:hypothetical protein n=1 Tax=unclassified Asanoa TaxID=2685164 RepID=UPI0034214B73
MLDGDGQESDRARHRDAAPPVAGLRTEGFGHAMKELLATLPDDPPPLPPGYLDTVLERGRRSLRRRRLGAAALLVVALAAAVTVISGVPRPAQPADSSQGSTVPDRFAGYSLFTSTVTKAPPGRAIALYGYGNGEMFNMFQPLVVGADADTYRRLDAAEDRLLPSALLAPDGKHVLLGDDRGLTDELTLLDLTTGEHRPIRLQGAVGVRLLAWSPDGRQVAYSAGPLSNSGELGTAQTVDMELARTGTLWLLDVPSGRSTKLAAIRSPKTAAFAADSRRLAVQVGQTAHVIALDGRESNKLDIPAGRELAADVGWSPDGRFLATVPEGLTRHDEFLWQVGDVAFISLTDDGTPPTTIENVTQLLGWRSSDSLIVATINGSDHLALAEVDRGTGSRRTLSRFDIGRTCELHTQTCQVFDLHLATGLLPELTVRDAGRPQRGSPWPTLVATIITVALAGAGYLVWRRIKPAWQRHRASAKLRKKAMRRLRDSYNS